MSAPAPEAADQVVQHQKLLEHRHALALAPELREQLAQAPAPRDVEPKRLGKVLLGMRRGVGGDVVGERGGHAATLEVHPFGVGHTVRLAHFAERAAEPSRARERPVVVQERVSQLVENQPGEHVPGDLVATPLAGDIAALDLDDLGGAVRHARDAGPEQYAVVPALETSHHEQLAHPAQRLADEVAPGGVLPAPGADLHPVVDPLAAMGADVLEFPIEPALWATAPRAEPHRVHHAAAASPAAATVIQEPLRRFERVGARALVGDVAPAPGAIREAVGHDPAAVIALCAGLFRGVAPLESPPAVRAVRPEARDLGRAGRAAQLRRRYLASTRSHAPSPRPRSA